MPEDITPKGNFEKSQTGMYSHRVESQPGEVYNRTKSQLMKSYQDYFSPESSPELKKKAGTILKNAVMECLTIVRGRLKRCQGEGTCIYSPICQEMIKNHPDEIPKELVIKGNITPFLYRGEKIVGRRNLSLQEKEQLEKLGLPIYKPDESIVFTPEEQRMVEAKMQTPEGKLLMGDKNE